MKQNIFDHKKFIKLCRTFPPDMEAIDKMLKGDVDLTKTCYGHEKNFLSEAMAYLVDGIMQTAPLREDLSNDSWYLYELTKRILAMGIDLSKDNWKVQDECLDLVFFFKEDYYGPEIIKLFLNAGANVERFINDDKECDDIFTICDINEKIGMPDNNIFEESNLSAAAEILYSARNGLPYEKIHAVENCVGRRIRNVYVGYGLERYSKSDILKPNPKRPQYRILFTDGQQLIVDAIFDSHMNPYDQTREQCCEVEGMNKCHKVKITEIKTFRSPDKNGRYYLDNLWLYLENSHILKFSEKEDADVGYITELRLESRAIKC